MKTVPMVAALVLTLAVSPASADAAELDPEAGIQELRSAINDLRTVGTAMYSWYVEQHGTLLTVGPSASQKGRTFDLSTIPLISSMELARLLVPEYLASIPRRDPWGGLYEYRLDPDPEASHAMAARSAGRDGRFSNPTYEEASFPKIQIDEDLVWTDGYFVRWPVP